MTIRAALSDCQCQFIFFYGIAHFILNNTHKRHRSHESVIIMPEYMECLKPTKANIRDCKEDNLCYNDNSISKLAKHYLEFLSNLLSNVSKV